MRNTYKKSFSNYKHKKTYKNWIKKIGESILTPKRKRDDDICSTNKKRENGKKFCSGTLGIPRRYMPQLNIPVFKNAVTKKYRVSVKKTNIRPIDLKPSQGEIRESKVKGLVNLMNNKIYKPGEIVVSEDGYVVDGHHRWAASLTHSPKKPIPALVIQSNIHDALGMAAAEGVEMSTFGGGFKNISI
jgi:hypothetical protein